MKKLIKSQVELRGAYGQPLGKNLEVKVSKEDLMEFGELCVKYIEEEARNAARYSTMLPKKEEFFKSFGYRLVGSSTVKIVSTWDWLPIYQNLQEQSPDEDPAFGKPKPFRMTHLTQNAGVHKVPMVAKDGTVIVRSAPLKAQDAWIHPGIARHTFVNKGLKRARDEFVSGLMERKLGEVLGGSDEG